MSEEAITVTEIGSLGGKATAARLSADERKKRARKAAEARWHRDVPVAEYEGELNFAGTKVPCAVLADGTRLLSERGVTKGFGLKRAGSNWQRGKDEVGARMPVFLSAKNLNPFIPADLRLALQSPLFYRPKSNPGVIAHGVRAEHLAAVCDVWLKARDAARSGKRVLSIRQEQVAFQADLIMRGFAHVGIIALVDEATGYQYSRDRDDLNRILQQYLSKELARWEKTFQDEFYEHLYRLKNWPRNPIGNRRGHAVARIAVNLTYARIHPDLIKELKQIREDSKKPHSKLIQWLTNGPNGGHPRLKQHLEGITALMSVARTWAQFQDWVNVRYPVINKTMTIPFQHPDDEPDESKA